MDLNSLNRQRLVLQFEKGFSREQSERNVKSSISEIIDEVGNRNRCVRSYDWGIIIQIKRKNASNIRPMRRRRNPLFVNEAVDRGLRIGRKKNICG